MDDWKSELSISIGKPVAEEKKPFSPMSVGSGSNLVGTSNLAEMVDALSRTTQGARTPTTLSPNRRVASPSRAAVGSSLLSFAAGGMPPPSVSAAMPASSASSVSAGLRSDGGTPQSQQNGSPLNASSKPESPMLKTQEEISPKSMDRSLKRNWDQAVSDTDQKQAELAQMQWNLCRDQMSAFSQDLMAVRAELRTVVGRQAELRHMLTMEESQRQDTVNKMDIALKNVQVQMEDTSRTVQTEISDRREGKDRTSRDMTFLEERLEKASQDFRSNHSMLTQTLDTERQERIQGEERRDERMRAYTAELQRSFEAEVSRIQQLFEEAERKRTMGAGQLSSEVQACTTKLDDLLHDRSATEVSFRKSIQEASDRLRNEVDAAAASLRGNVSEEGTKRKVEMSGMTDTLQRLRVELDREIADRAKGDEQTTALISQLRTELAEGTKARKEGEERLSAEIRHNSAEMRESSRALSRAAGDDEIARQLREARQLIEQEVKDRQAWEEKSTKRLEEFSSMLDGERKDREEIGQRLQAVQGKMATEQPTQNMSGASELRQSINLLERETGDQLRQLRQDFEGKRAEEAADMAGRVKTLADALNREVKDRVGGHEAVMKVTKEHRELAVKEAQEHRTASLDLKMQCEDLAAAHEQGKGELQALASAHEQGSKDLQALSAAHEQAQSELQAQLGSIRQEVQENRTAGQERVQVVIEAQERGRAELDTLTTVQERMRGDVQALSNVHEHDKGKLRAELAQIREERPSGGNSAGGDAVQKSCLELRQALDAEVMTRANEVSELQHVLLTLRQALEEQVLRSNQRLEEESSARAVGFSDLLDRVNAVSSKLSAEARQTTRAPAVDSRESAGSKEGQDMTTLQGEIQEVKNSLQAVVDGQTTVEGLHLDVSALRQAVEDEAKERLKGDQEMARLMRESPRKASTANPPMSGRGLASPLSSPLTTARSTRSTGEAPDPLEEWKASICQAMANVERNLTELIEDETSKRKAALQVEASHRAQGDSDARVKVAEVMEEVKTCRHMLDEESRMRIETSEVTQEAWRVQHEDEVHARVVATVSLQQDLEELRTHGTGSKLQGDLEREREARVKAYVEFEELRGIVKDERKARELAERGFEAMMGGFSEKLKAKDADTERLVNEARRAFQVEAEHLWQALDSHTHDVDIGSATAPNPSSPKDKDERQVPYSVAPEGVVCQSASRSGSPRQNFTAVVKRSAVTPGRARRSTAEASQSSRQPSQSPGPSSECSRGLPGTTIYKGHSHQTSKGSLSMPIGTPPCGEPKKLGEGGSGTTEQLEASPKPSDDGLSGTVTGLTLPGSPRSVPVTPNPKDFQRLQQILVSHGSSSNAPPGKSGSSRQNSQSQRGHRGHANAGSASSRQRPSRDDYSEIDSTAGGSTSTTSRSIPNGEVKISTMSNSNSAGKMANAGSSITATAHRQPPRSSGSPPPQKASPVQAQRSGSIRVSPPLSNNLVTPPPGVRMLIGTAVDMNRPALSNPPTAGRGYTAQAVVTVGAGTPNFSPTYSWRATERERGGKAQQAHCLPAQYGRQEQATPPRQQLAPSHSSSMSNI